MSILPLPPPPSPDELRAIGIRPNEYRLIDTTETWWRVHRTTAVHTLAWNAFRTFGPVLRFDPHPQPRGHHPTHGVWYGATNPGAALGEAFQNDRTIDRAFEIPYLTGLRFTRTLHLLDVSTDSTGHWPTRAGGTYAISTAGHDHTQRWARAIVDAFPHLDGISYNSRFTGALCAALFSRAQDAMPTAPLTSRALTDPALATRLAGVADKLGYKVV
ncbi:RES family NAD+ phosphorylase [Rhodococcus koreensis]|uniref:RES domain-containing protein n=1 Tax=Rhodococcus koreensis TaxID=99653 RepID=A0A1H4M1V5_9NOCA|nr:RES family NAD+ phosphorylase [Rhodococcus koreensis]SEB76936.1 RES domain-containing protein [Rhodococcus koreensis]